MCGKHQRTRIFKCNDHRLDELFFYPFSDLQASEKNNFIGRVSLSLTMKTMFLWHNQKSINSKLKFKGSEWKPIESFLNPTIFAICQNTSFSKKYIKH